MKHYIIDGYNLGFLVPEIVADITGGRFDLAVKRTITLVKSRINPKKSRIIIVFDGRQSAGQNPPTAGGLIIMFSKTPEKADDVIRRFVRKNTDNRNWCVVSSDHEIQNTARDHGARVMTSQQFLKLALATRQSNPPDNMNAKYNAENIDVDYWKDLFSGRKEE